MARRLRPRRSARETSSSRSTAPRAKRSASSRVRSTSGATGASSGSSRSSHRASSPARRPRSSAPSKGRDPKPTVHAAAAVRARLRGAPTLVQNVETLAHMALIARHGPDWFRALGTRDEPGSGLFTVSGAVGRPGVYEAAFGSPLRALVAQAGGVRGEPGRIPRRRLLRQLGRAVHGAGAVAARRRARRGGCGARRGRDRRAPGGRLRARPVRPRRALPCRGERGPMRPVRARPAALAGALEALAAGRGDSRPDALRWLQQVAGRGACRHPDGAVRFIESSLEVFADEVELHLRGRCSGRRGEFLPTTRSAREPRRPRRPDRLRRQRPLRRAPARARSRSTTGAIRSSTRARCRPSSSSMPSGPSGPARSSRSLLRET